MYLFCPMGNSHKSLKATDLDEFTCFSLKKNTHYVDQIISPLLLTLSNLRVRFKTQLQ